MGSQEGADVMAATVGSRVMRQHVGGFGDRYQTKRQRCACAGSSV
jgi:hypothetical protein